MKKIHFTIPILFFAVIFVFYGCKKLNEITYSTLSTLDNASEANAATVGIYQGFFTTFIAEIEFQSMAECGHKYSSCGSDGDGYWNDPYYDYTYTPSQTGFSTTWAMLYNIINRANNVIVNVPGLNDSTVTNPLVGEAKFLRAWSYFTLVQFYGKVPLHLQPTTSLADAASVYKPASPVDSVYAAIVSDLQSAIQYLPLTQPTANLGRATQAAAIGLLGKVYLTMAGNPLNQTAYYQKAADLLGQLVQNESTYNLQLLTDYQNIFSINNEMNNEILFAFRGNTNNNTDVNGSIWNWLWCAHGMTAITQSQFGERWDIARLYEPSDIRLSQGVGLAFRAIANYDAVGINAGDSIYYDTVSLFKYVSVSNPANTWGAPHYGIGLPKWNSSAIWIGWPGGGNKDYIILRYSDVLLCQAEALNEAGHTSDALVPLNRVRNRAGASSCPNAMYPGTDQETVRQAIRDERRRELVGEGNTINDVRRWGTLQQEMAGFRLDQFAAGRVVPVYDPKFELYPIPTSELATDNKLTQNPGW